MNLVPDRPQPWILFLPQPAQLNHQGDQKVQETAHSNQGGKGMLWGRAASTHWMPDFSCLGGLLDSWMRGRATPTA